jgi:hypothetical protein
MHRHTLLLTALGLAAASGTATAGILGMQQLKLDFTRPEVAKRVTWTKAARLKLGPRGLLFDAPGPEALDLTLQTIEPFATGLSWRPAGSVSIRATLVPAPAPIRLDNGQSYTPAPGQLFVRYSPDAKHWSTWQPLASTTEAKGVRFTGQLVVPRQASAEYHALVARYMKLDVPWRSDEEACVRWILRSQPGFFAKHQPFIGYLQLLYEASLAGGQRLERLDVDVSYGIGGLHLAPKDPKARQGREGPWRFKAP